MSLIRTTCQNLSQLQGSKIKRCSGINLSTELCYLNLRPKIGEKPQVSTKLHKLKITPSILFQHKGPSNKTNQLVQYCYTSIIQLGGQTKIWRQSSTSKGPLVNQTGLDAPKADHLFPSVTFRGWSSNLSIQLRQMKHP